LVALVAEADVSPVMQVVRYFHHERGVEAPSEADPLMVERQPRPLGWNLDEYDLSDETPGPRNVTGR
jgi:hypothetical protein